jgi:antitoxin MazE
MKAKRAMRSTSKKASGKGAKRLKPPANTIPLVRIGNSRGVRLPKAVIEHARLGNRVELIVRDREVVLKSLEHPRAGWDEMMRQAIAEHGSELTAEDREWLEAPIDARVEDGGKDWPW